MAGPDVVDGVRESVSEEVAPRAVDEGLGDVRFVAGRHQAGQLFAAIDLAARIDLLVEKDRIGDLHFAAAFFVIDRAREFGAHQLGVIGHPLPGRAVQSAVLDLPRLPQEAVEFPKLGLFPRVERDGCGTGRTAAARP